MTTAEKAKQYFENNKEAKELFATSDGFLFLLKKDAQNHAQTLEDSTVDSYTNEVEDKVVTETPDKTEQSDSEGETVTDTSKFNFFKPKK
jgi:hypothetical protein|nr:MAG TPA: hypothetical protein [Caudoviricetes sp.]